MYKRFLFYSIILVVILTGCTNTNELTNKAPVIISIKNDVSVEEGKSITLTMDLVEAQDEDVENLTLIVLEGENYSLSGTTVTPAEGFFGTLSVPLVVSDGELNSDESFISIVVLEKINKAPVLVKTFSDVVPKGKSITLTLSHVEFYDEDSDDLSLIVHEGENYSLNGTTVAPSEKFTGQLYVPVQISDGELQSHIDTVVLKVKNMDLYPLITGAWWEYSTSEPYADTGRTTRYEILNSIDIMIEGEAKSVYRTRWDNSDEYGLIYLMSSDNEGTKLHGAYTNSDTLLSTQFILRNPIMLNKSWNHLPLIYNITVSELFQGTEQTTTCTDTSVYITVPAGVFKCIEFTTDNTLSYTRAADNIVSFNSAQFPMSQPVRAFNNRITEKKYYAEGVGLVKVIILQDDEIVLTTGLTTYSLE